MNYQNILQAKIDLLTYQANTGIYVGLALVLASSILILISLKKDWDLGAILGGVIFITSLTVIGCGFYKLSIVDLKAKSDLANYALIQLQK